MRFSQAYKRNLTLKQRRIRFNIGRVHRMIIRNSRLIVPVFQREQISMPIRVIKLIVSVFLELI